jgi:hypothetical protein
LVKDSSGELVVYVAVKPLGEAETVPGIGTPVDEYTSSKVNDVTVHGSTGLLNSTCTTPFIGTPVSELVGLETVTDGVVVSLAVPVVIEMVPGLASTRPPTSMICEVVTME